MPRAIWTGSIGFGLVSIPVRLYPAISPKDVRFREVDRRSGRRVRRRSVVVDEPPPPEEPWSRPDTSPEPERMAEPPSGDAAPSTAAPAAQPSGGERPRERTVERDDIVKAFEVEPGRVVEVEVEEIEAARPERSRVIDVERFVELADIDPVYFEKSYHLAPADEAARRPYALLRAVMERTDRVAIGRFVLRTKEHLVAVRPTLGILGLETLYYADEVNAPAPAWLTHPQPTSRELELSEALVEALAAEWDPAEFEDRHRSRLMELIGSKEPREAAPEEIETASDGIGVQDLMEALRASVEQATGRPATGRRRDVGRTADTGK